MRIDASDRAALVEVGKAVAGLVWALVKVGVLVALAAAVGGALVGIGVKVATESFALVNGLF